MRRLALAGLAGGTGLLLARPIRYVPYPDLAARLDAAVGGTRLTYRWRHWDVSYRMTGTGTPLLLLHGINAVPSSFEMRRNFTALGSDFCVYAPDLLGFGLSDRPRTHYSAGLYVTLLQDFMRDVIGTPCHVIASSLSSAFAVRAAYEQPDLVRALVLICPTGIEALDGPRALTQRIFGGLLGLPVLGPRLFAALVSRPSVRYFLHSMICHEQDRATPEIVESLHRLGQRPGGRWAPQAFIGGRLNLDIRQAFAALRQPILLVWGKEATITPLRNAPAFLERNPHATLKVFADAGLLPHDEQADLFNPYVRDWLKEQEA